MFDFLKKLLGTKSEKDVKNLEGKVEEINSIYNSLATISNNDLRQRTNSIKAKLQEAIKEEKDKIQAVKTKIDADDGTDVNA